MKSEVPFFTQRIFPSPTLVYPKNATEKALSFPITKLEVLEIYPIDDK